MGNLGMGRVMLELILKELDVSYGGLAGCKLRQSRFNCYGNYVPQNSDLLNITPIPEK